MHSRLVRALCLLLLPLLFLALTGRVVPQYSVSGRSASKGYGWINVQYNAPADAQYPTDWRVVDGYGPSAYAPVRPRGTAAGPREVPVGRYMLQFKMTDPASPHQDPPDLRVDVVAQKVTTYFIRY